jgi:hypothetical protein
MATASILTSIAPSESFSALIEAVLSWYVPFVAMIYIIRDKDDLVFILKIICVSAVIISMIGFLEFYFHHRLLLDIFPGGMLQALIASNPALGNLLPNGNDFRNGLFRSPSVFLSPLSYGEFNIIVIPIGLFFALYRQNSFERSLGWAVTIGGIVGIFSSGSRGGWVGLLASMAVFIAFWSVRKRIDNKASLAPAIAGLIGAVSFAVVIGLIIVWPKAHNMVLGGDVEAGSTDARYAQWAMAIPYIKANPITGHGFVMGGTVINSSIDSYVISLLVETGVAGLVFFAGIVLLPVWYGLRNQLSDMSERGALAGALACSFIAFTMDRLVLSERENNMLIFSLLGMVVYLNYEYAKERVTEQRNSRLKVNSGARIYGRVGQPVSR